MNMPILAQFAENQKTIEIDGAVIRQDQYGRYCINDLHKSAASVKVDFVAVLDRQYTKRGAS